MPTKPEKQAEFWKSAFVHWSTVLTKLHEVGRDDLIGSMAECHQGDLQIACVECGNARTVTNRCERRWCPLCTPRLARERREELEHWALQLKQPKHVVLTARNTQTLTRTRVREFRAAIAKLRRSAGARNWRSGTWSLELTNESAGWHLHAHLLVDARWIDGAWLSRAWGKLMGQDFAVVKVKDARAEDYLKELLKYVVKSSQLASWDGHEIAEFMVAFKGTRSFGVFGDLTGRRKEWRQSVRAARAKFGGCPCGCRRFTIRSQQLADFDPMQTPHDPTRKHSPQDYLPLRVLPPK
jgi:hypothetical protein